MEPPSSPPLLPVHVNPDTSVREQLPPTIGLSASRLSHGRKRRRDDSSYTNSSDPALFSSDDPSASVDDYEVGRKKRPWIGTWWETQICPSQLDVGFQGKREFKRNFDSGVFMGSDSSDQSSDLPLPEPVQSPYDESIEGNSRKRSEEALRRLSSNLNLTFEPDTVVDVETSSINALQKARKMAREMVDACIEHGNPSIDLSGLELETIETSLIKSLPLIMIQSRRRSKPDPEEYMNLRPKLHLFLGENKLSKVPGEIWTLQNLSNLSLRNNNLTNIPPQISNIEELSELNLAVNSLSHLPFSLNANWNKKLRKIFLKGNPLLLPIHPSLGTSADPLEFKRPHPSKPPAPLLAARSTICYFDINGAPLFPTNPPPSRILSNPSPKPQRYPSEIWHTPSLYELALRKCNAPQLVAEVSTMDPQDYPDSIFRHLRHAAEIRTAGPLKCDECGNSYIVKRAEWIEWRLDTWLPLLKTVCSWKCANPGLPEWRGGEWVGCGWRAPNDDDFKITCVAWGEPK